MTSANTRSTRRKFLATSALAGAIGVFLPAAAAHAETKPPAPSAAETLAPAPTTSIRPLPKIHMPQEAIEELRRRIAATRWPEKETVSDQSL